MVSSNSLFHFTKEDSLFLILKNGLRPSYSFEDFYDGESGLISKWHVPMICFCDIPLTKVENHISKFGSYGIGFNRDWALKHRINPVHYSTGSDSAIYGAARTLEAFMQFEGTESPFSLSNFTIPIIEMAANMKPFEGTWYKTGNHVKFYDEREWRYIPNFNKFLAGNPNYLRIPDISSIPSDSPLTTLYDRSFHPNPLKMALDIGKASLANQFLEFSESDVKYIIYANSSEKEKIEAKIYSIPRFSEHEKWRLTNKMVSIEDIRNDF